MIETGKITYHREGDYLFPNLYAPRKEPVFLGKYGRLRKTFLKERYPAYYALMMQKGTLDETLLEMDEIATERVYRITQELLKTHPAPDRNEDFLAYVGHMNNLTAMAEETVMEELVYVRPSKQ